MKLSRTQLALVAGVGTIVGAAWLFGSSSENTGAVLSSVQAAVNQSPVSPIATAAATGSQSSSPAVARLGNIAVTQDEMEQLLRNLPEATRLQLEDNRPALDQWLRARLAEEALLAQAIAQGWEERPEVKSLTEAAQKQLVLQTYLDSVSQVPANYPSADELAAAYEENKAQLIIPAQYRVSQVFFAAPYFDAEAVANARTQATEVAKKARAKGADFAALAKENSQDAATAAKGGDSGWTSLAELVPEIRSSVALLKKDGISELVQSQAGFHVLKLVDYRPEETPELAQVEDQLREALRRQHKGTVAKAYLDGLVDAGTLSIDGARLNAAFDAVR